MYLRLFEHNRNLPQLSLILLITLITVLWISGGASRADVSGQAVARLAAWGALAIYSVYAVRTDFAKCKAVAWLMMAFVALPLLQLIPLPQSVWNYAFGHDLFAVEKLLENDDQLWRPLSIAPSATLNSLSSLIIPVATLFLVSSIRENEKHLLIWVTLVLVVASILVGLLQFSGVGVVNPLVNYMRGMVSGTFANRNHFALLLALGCLVAPVWAVMKPNQIGWRVPLAFGIIILAQLIILASGSRAGMVVGALSLIIGPFIVREHIRGLFRKAPRWVMPTAVVAMAVIVFALLFVSVNSGRAVSIDRLSTVQVSEDMRSLALPTVLEMIFSKFPVGIGMGGFDTAFRISEPKELLQVLYFNHAHSDWLELVLEGGALSVALMIAALTWWGKASVHVWRPAKSHSHVQIIGRLGSTIILMILLASVVDYPARTPLIMAMIVVAACWLAWGEREVRDAASLPSGSRSL